MRTEPKSDAEIQAMMVMPEGTYPFVVIESKERVSKNGNDMIELKLEVLDDQSRAHTIFDYLLASMAFKLKHFCEATGLSDKYDADDLTAADCLRKRGYVEIKADKAPRIVDGREYAPKNSVKDYCAEKPDKPVEFHSGSAPVDQNMVDDIPF